MRISDWSSDVCSSDLKDPKYQPLPRAIVVRGNQHGKAGYAPKFPGGEQVAAAMGGSIPPILWDGAGDAIVLDDVGVLSLNLPDVATPQSERSEEHTSELQSLMRISYAVFCLKKKNITTHKMTQIYPILKYLTIQLYN